MDESLAHYLTDEEEEGDSGGFSEVQYTQEAASSVEEGQILEETSSDCSESIRTGKRPCSVLSENGATEARPQKKTKKRISFSDVTAYYFPRAQGFTCVPSQGGSTLGMALKHSHEESFSLSEHASQQRRKHRRLLLQLRKRRKSQRQAINNAANTEANESTTAAIENDGPVVSEVPSTSNSIVNDAKEETKEVPDQESESDEESDTGQPVSDISDSELDVDNYYFLQPVPTRQRRLLLRESGVGRIEPSEKDDCKEIRTSRESCGCTCQVYCEPESCSCAQSGIQCQVDRLNFPCGCSRDACANPSGRVEFNPVRVRTHFIHTLMRLELENAADQQASTSSPSKGNILMQQHHQHLLHQPLQPIDEFQIVDGASSASLPVDPSYNWETVAPIVPTVQHSGYPLVDPTVPTDATWFGHYGHAEAANHPAYVYPVTTSYDPVGAYEYQSADRVLTVEQPQPISSSTQYTELDTRASEQNGSYFGNYNDFEHSGFSTYETPDAYHVASEDVVYGYVEEPSFAPNLEDLSNGQQHQVALMSQTDGISTNQTTAVVATAGESSSSSSEEDALTDMSSSLAAIVKETMVSV